MLKALANEQRYDSQKSSVSTWIYTITRSVVADYYRKYKVPYFLDDTLPDNIDLERDVEYEEELSELAEQLRLLSERERKIIVLRIYNDMEYAQIAKIMSISEVNTRAIYSRAIKKLREKMA
jgi:RNA polymerase sigma-70 factor (ECF subfamily)